MLVIFPGHESHNQQLLMPPQGCNRRLDPLLSYPAWVRRTDPTGISNDAMGSVPHHPFFTLVIESLIPYDRNWKLPYITVMYSTGPLFLSVIWQKYKQGRARDPVTDVLHTTSAATAGRWDGSETGRVRVLMADEYNRQPWAFFRWHGGSSWHGKDARLVFWMGRHWVLLTVSGFLCAGVVGLCLWWIYSRFLIYGERRRKGGNPGWGSPSWTKRIPLFRTTSSKAYELLERHEV